MKIIATFKRDYKGKMVTGHLYVDEKERYYVQTMSGQNVFSPIRITSGSLDWWLENYFPPETFL